MQSGGAGGQVEAGLSLKALWKVLLLCPSNGKVVDRVLWSVGNDKVPLLSWEREAYGLATVCLNQATNCPQIKEDVYLVADFSHFPSFFPPKIYCKQTKIGSE